MTNKDLPVLFFNEKAGSLLSNAHANAYDYLASLLKDVELNAELQPIRHESFISKLRDVCQGGRSILIAGGDGSVSAALQVLGGTDTVLGIIPLGTMNFLARDLGMSVDPSVALAQIKTAIPEKIDIAQVNGHYFHSLAGIGQITRMAEERANMREWIPKSKMLGVAIAFAKSFLQSTQLKVKIEDGQGNETVETPVILVTNNLFQGSEWRRNVLDQNLLELNIARGDVAFPLLRSGLSAIAGSWRENDNVMTRQADRFTLSFHERKIWAAIDGELTRMKTPLVFKILPKFLTVLKASSPV